MEKRLQSSASQREIMEKEKISSVEDLIYADLRRSGWTKGDAFYAAYRDYYSGYTKKQQTALINQLEDAPGVKARINSKTTNSLSTKELAKETSKEKVLSDLVLAKKRLKEGTKEWIDLTKMIADYTKIKQDDIKVDEQPIRYFIPEKYPRNCDECLVGKKMIKKNTP